MLGRRQLPRSAQPNQRESTEATPQTNLREYGSRETEQSNLRGLCYGCERYFEMTNIGRAPTQHHGYGRGRDKGLQLSTRAANADLEANGRRFVASW